MTALIEASGQQPVLGSPKSAASERAITLPQIVISAFEHHLAEYAGSDTGGNTGRFTRSRSFPVA